MTLAGRFSVGSVDLSTSIAAATCAQGDNGKPAG